MSSLTPELFNEALAYARSVRALSPTPRATQPILFMTSACECDARFKNDLALACALVVRGALLVPLLPFPLAEEQELVVRLWREGFNLEPLALSNLVDRYDREIASVYAESVTPDTIAHISRENFRVGAEAEAFANVFSVKGHVSDLDSIRTHVRQIVVTQCGIERLFKTQDFKSVLLSDWRGYPWTLAARYAYAANVPAYVSEVQEDATAIRCYMPSLEDNSANSSAAVWQSASFLTDLPQRKFNQTTDSLLAGKSVVLDWLCDAVMNRQALVAVPSGIPSRTDRVSNQSSQDATTRIIRGFDEQGGVRVGADFVQRHIWRGKGQSVRELLERDRISGFSRFGLVAARVTGATPSEEYDLVLEHPRVPVISYSHEWPVEMLKSAIKFEIDLQRNLLSQGCILKDWGALLNVLFNGTTPLWVDYLSVVPLERLPSEAWLLEGLPAAELSAPLASCFLNQMWRRVFSPHSILPLALLGSKSSNARSRIAQTAMNVSEKVLGWEDIENVSPELIAHLRGIETRIIESFRTLNLDNAFSLVHELIDTIPNPFSHSGYVDYYQEKGEDFSVEPSGNWKPKQKAVHAALQQLRPRTVADIGANTGWFSFLAAHLGAHVTACEIDEACVNVLYNNARARSASVLPLVVDFLNLQPEVPAWSGYESSCSESSRLQHQRAPIMLSAKERFQSDVVMALAIIHHLVLGMGKKLETVLDSLGQLARKGLIVEFVELHDPLIQAELSFFPALQQSPDAATGYTRERLHQLLSSNFSHVQATPLSPTRWLYVATR